MMSYSLALKPSLEKDFRSLPKTIILRVVKRIIALQDDPTPPQAIKLTGMETMYRIRVGDYRIIYELDDDTIVVHYVRHRRDAYRQL